MRIIKVMFLTIIILLLRGGIVSAQVKVDGVVYNQQTNKPLSGASVIIGTTNLHLLTDSLGEFQLKLEALPSIISFSHVGFETLNYVVTEFESIKIPLVPINVELEEVTINTGYQSVPQERATGSFETIGVSSLNQIMSSNILDRLEGNSSLLFDKHDNRPAITMRGFNTINGNKDPLIVLDNFPYDGDIENINPNDVESITLLKDAAAQSIWGTRAGNGVIVITTKKGKFNSAPKIGFSSNFQIADKPNLNYYNLISASDLIDLEKYLFAQGYYKSAEKSSSKGYLSPVVTMLIANRENSLSDDNLTAELNKLRLIEKRDQYMEGVYRNSVNQQYSLNFTSGWDKISFFLSGGFDKNRDALDNDRQRINVRNNISYKLSNSIDFNVGLNYSHRKNTAGKSGFDLGNSIRPYIKLYDENKEALAKPGLNSFYLDSIKDLGLLDWNEYPYIEHTFVDNVSSSRNLQASLSLKYRLSDWINFDVIYSTDRQDDNTEKLQGKESYFTRNLINRFSAIDPVTGKISQNLPYGDILDNSRSNINANNYRAQMNIAKDWGVHSIHAILGGEIRSIGKEGSDFRTYGFDEDVLTTSKVNYNVSYSNFVSGGAQYIPYVDDFQKIKNNYVSQYFNGAYTYNSKYVLSASIRRDASNLFGLATNDKWQPLWSIGASWKISDEGFYSANSLPDLKLKVTYGKSGLVNQQASAVPIVSYRTAPITNYQAAVLTQYPNPELRWEKSAMINIGLDIGSVTGRIQGTIAYYRKKGTDLFGPSPMDITAGVGNTITRNVADMEGYGLDANLAVRWVNTDFKWRTDLFFNYTESKVTDYYNTSEMSYDYVSDGNVLSPRIGKPLYSLLLYDFSGLDEKGNPVGMLQGEKSIDYRSILEAHYDNLAYAGSAVPIIYGSIMNSFSYKKLNMSINIIYKMGHYFKAPMLSYSRLIDMYTLNGSGYYEQRWQKPGDEKTTNVPAFLYPLDSYRETFYTTSNAEVYKGDHIRLNFVRLSYDFNNLMLGKQRTNMKLFVNAENLGIIWKAAKGYIDPDFVDGLPNSKRFSMGLSVNL